MLLFFGFNNHLQIFGPHINFVQILLRLYVWVFQNLAVCWNVIKHLLLGVVWGNTNNDQIHNFEEGQIFNKLAAVFLNNTIGNVVCSPWLTPCLQIQAWSKIWKFFPMLFYFQWPGPAVICKNWDKTWTSKGNTKIRCLYENFRS